MGGGEKDGAGENKGFLLSLTEGSKSPAEVQRAFPSRSTMAKKNRYPCPPDGMSTILQTATSTPHQWRDCREELTSCSHISPSSQQHECSSSRNGYANTEAPLSQQGAFGEFPPCFPGLASETGFQTNTYCRQRPKLV